MATKTASVPGKSFVHAGVKYDPNEVESIELSRIYNNRSWNSRRQLAEDTTDEKGNAEGRRGWSNLVCSLATSAQRDPILVRPNPEYDPKRKGEQYREFTTVYGHQRYDAKLFIATQSSEVVEILQDPKQGDMTPADIAKLADRNPTIRAFVQQLDEVEARSANLAENMQHNSLSPGDLVHGVYELIRVAPEMSSVKMAIILNQNQPFVAKLKRIAEGTGSIVIPAGKINKDQGEPVTILEAWREAPKRLTQNEMDSIAREEDPTKKVEKYLAAAVKKADGVTEEGKPKQGKGVWCDNACTISAPKVGALLVALRDLGVIDVNDKIEGEAAVRACMVAVGRTVPESATGADIGRISDAINRSMTDAAKAAKKSKTGENPVARSKKNGAAASA